MGYRVLPSADAFWRPSNMLGVLNTDLGKQLGASELAARLWRLRPGEASTRHRHPQQQELYLVLEGTGRIRIGDEAALSLDPLSALVVDPETVRQIFNDTPQDALWLVVGAPVEAVTSTLEMTPELLALMYPDGPRALPPSCPAVEARPRSVSRSRWRGSERKLLATLDGGGQLAAQLPVEVLERPRDRTPRVAAGGRQAAGASHARELGRTVEQVAERGCEGLRLFRRRDEQPFLTAREKRLETGDEARHDGSPAAHGLEQRHAEARPLAGRAEEIGCGEVARPGPVPLSRPVDGAGRHPPGSPRW